MIKIKKDTIKSLATHGKDVGSTEIQNKWKGGFWDDELGRYSKNKMNKD